jgi:hypothetical protein
MDRLRPPPRDARPDIPDRLRWPEHARGHIGQLRRCCAGLVARWDGGLFRLQPHRKLGRYRGGSLRWDGKPRVTHHGGFAAFESYVAKTLYRKVRKSSTRADHLLSPAFSTAYNRTHFACSKWSGRVSVKDSAPHKVTDSDESGISAYHGSRTTKRSA